MIEVDRLVKLYGSVKAVDDISFSVQRGEIVGFLGPNGAGKTTTMRILTCFIPPTSGRATVAGFDISRQSIDVRSRVGYLPESVPLYPEMRVREYLNYRAKLKGVPRADRTKKVDYVLGRCRLADVDRRLVGTLSKGYRQRVGLAEALVHDPDILVLDEPTVGLDPNQIRETRKLIKELGQRHTILLSTHILPEVEMICERVIIIDSGQITLSDRLQNLQQGAIIEVECRGPADKVRAVLRTIDEIGDIKDRPAADGLAAFDLTTRQDQDVRETVCDRLTRNGWTLRQLNLRRQTLEDHFVAATLGRKKGER